jgi:hypothetical protein
MAVAFNANYCARRKGALSHQAQSGSAHILDGCRQFGYSRAKNCHLASGTEARLAALFQAHTRHIGRRIGTCNFARRRPVSKARAVRPGVGQAQVAGTGASDTM